MAEKKNKPSADMLQQAVDAVNALVVMFNTAQVYRIEHDVFRTVLAQKGDTVLTAIRPRASLHLIFQNGEILYLGDSLNPGSRLYQEFSRRMHSYGIWQVEFLHGTTVENLAAWIDIVITNREKIAETGMKPLLKKAGLKTIREPKARYEWVEEGQSVRSEREAGGLGAYEISLGGDDWVIGPEMAAAEVTDGLSVEARAFRNVAVSVLEAVRRHARELPDAADELSSEFDRRLTDKVEKVRQESEQKIQRLNTVKDLVLTEMDKQKIAAIIVTASLDVVACNKLGTKYIGAARRLDPSSVLGGFIRSGVEEKELLIDGEERMVRLVLLMDTPEKRDIMLIAVE